MRYVCPKNGEPTQCLVEKNHTHRHRREEWVTDGKTPICETHKIEMIKALSSNG